MKCRICGSEIVCYEKLQNVPYDVNSVYTKPVGKSGGGMPNLVTVKHVSTGKWNIR